MISRGLTFWDGKARIAIRLNVIITLQKAVISLNKHEHCMFKVRCCAALLHFYQTLHLLAANEWAFSIKLLFRSEFNAKIAPCFYPANTQSFKFELVDRYDSKQYSGVRYVCDNIVIVVLTMCDLILSWKANKTYGVCAYITWWSLAG